MVHIKKKKSKEKNSLSQRVWLPISLNIGVEILFWDIDSSGRTLNY